MCNVYPQDDLLGEKAFTTSVFDFQEELNKRSKIIKWDSFIFYILLTTGHQDCGDGGVDQFQSPYKCMIYKGNTAPTMLRKCF